MTWGKPWLCMFIVQVSQETALTQYYGFSGKVVLKRPFFSSPDEVSALHIHWSGFIRERALSLYNSFIAKVILKRLFLVALVKPQCSVFIFQVFWGQIFEQFSWETKL